MPTNWIKRFESLKCDYDRTVEELFDSIRKYNSLRDQHIKLIEKYNSLVATKCK